MIIEYLHAHPGLVLALWGAFMLTMAAIMGRSKPTSSPLKGYDEVVAYLSKETGTTVTTLTLTQGEMVVEFYHEGKHYTVTTPVVKNYRVEELNTAVLRAIRSKI